MRETEIPITFQPRGTTVYVLAGTRLLEAAATAELVLDTPCGGEGTCGKCRVVVTEGAGAPTAAEAGAFSCAELAAGCRLACQSRVRDPTTVHVPEASLVSARQQILVRAETAVQASGDPVVVKQYVELPPPARGSDAPDTLRLEKAVGRFEVELDVLRDLPRLLREAAFRGTAVLSGTRLLDFEPGNTQWDSYGVALDLGTTTLAAALLDLTTGRQLHVAAQLNPQTRFGDDVLSRIQHARDCDGGLEDLHRAVVGSIDEMVGRLCSESGIGRHRVYCATISGNTTMQQIFAGIDPSRLGEVPFVPVISRGIELHADSLGLRIHPQGRVYLLPVIGGFVGGDTVAGMLATGLAECDRPTLLIDIGTNGEIVLAAGGKLTAASTAAGPAFEGARISQGMRASSGAIEKVVTDGQLRLQVIDNVPPRGLCGSGLIDAAAELLRHGVLTTQGRLQSPDELPAGIVPDLARRVICRDGQCGFVLADEQEAEGGSPVVLTQRDLRELQLATGAIRAGVNILLRRAGLEAKDLDRVLLAGGFGNFIRRSNAQRIGLLPWGIEHRRIRYQGNTSLAGARLATLSRTARQKAEELALNTEHVDLSFEPGFHTAFAEAMLFPESS
jgi:uncharacterized 2Fe-2S/4Fe-4S cluster protein (DUF4445 family)